MEKIVTFPRKPAVPKSKPRNMTSDGRRCVRVDAGYDPDTGKRIRKAFYGKTLKEAQQKANEYKQAKEAGINLTAQKYNVSQWIDVWYKTYGQKAGFSANTSQDINLEKIRRSLGRLKLTDVRQANVQTFADSLSGYSKSEVAKVRQTASQIFQSAVINRIILFNPCEGVRWDHAGSGSHRRLEDWEIDLIVRHWRVHRGGFWAMLMLFTGMRRGELLALRWSDVDLDANVIHIRSGVHFEGNSRVMGPPKTESSVRDIPILPILRDVFAQADHLSEEWVCTGAEGQPVTQSIWASSWRAWLNTMSNILNGDAPHEVCPGRRSDLDDQERKRFDVRSHDFRHTFASMMYDADADIKTAQALLGHASSEITMDIYTHLSSTRQTVSIDKIEAYTEKHRPASGHQMGIR